MKAAWLKARLTLKARSALRGARSSQPGMPSAVYPLGLFRDGTYVKVKMVGRSATSFAAFLRNSDHQGGARFQNLFGTLQSEFDCDQRRKPIAAGEHQFLTLGVSPLRLKFMGERL